MAKIEFDTKADKDLTEETEKMILKRYEFALESAEHMLRFWRFVVDRPLV
jgi:hypothetical protein